MQESTRPLTRALTHAVWIRCLIACLVCLVTAVPATQASEVSGVKFEEKIRLGATELVLNGAGIRYAAAGLVRVYVIGLYLPQKRTTSGEIAALRGPKRVQIHLLRDINANDFSRGLLQGIKNNLNMSEQQKHFDSLVRLGHIFGQVPSMKRGEIIQIDQIPSTGTVVLLNGKRASDPFPDETFWNALVQIWIGPKPIEESLKPVLLGLVPSNDNAVRH
ncbi:MAG: chalcone isomerase family protein [Casimicrobiaceae bacterium]|nr:chalcone isomerase family protein [Casimicrobiaceae bacterium]